MKEKGNGEMTENRYIAFLRGINISGKNKIAMSDLKREFEHLGFTDVSTYLNSGNVLFSSENRSIADMKCVIEKMLCTGFGLEIPVHVISREDLEDVLTNAPVWWGTGDKAQYDNLIFILTSDTAKEICDMLGQPSEGLERIQVYKDIIFWSFDRKAYQKCNWWKKTAGAGIAERLTIRTANMVRKMCQ